MDRQTIRDAQYRPIGYIDTDAQGRQTILDDRYRRLGSYDPRTNVTTDAQYRRVGSGNLLVGLLNRR